MKRDSKNVAVEPEVILFEKQIIKKNICGCGTVGEQWITVEQLSDEIGLKK